MKTPKEIKKGFIDAMEDASWVVEGGDAHDLIDAVEKAHASMADALACIERLEAQIPRWISVEETLPKYGERVLITEGTCVFEAYRSISNKWVRNGIGWAEDVTHWMPLPEPPKEG